MFTNRRPYYGLKMSTTDFFREPVRYLKESNTQESMMEKPYLEDEYPKMHLKLPDFKFKPREIPSIFGPIADGEPFPGLAMVDFGDANCGWYITNIYGCVKGSVLIHMWADYFWHAEFNFIAGIVSDSIGVSLTQLAGTEASGRDRQSYRLNFPENADGSVTVCGFASAHVLVSQTFETVVAGMPIGIHLVGGALLPIERGQTKPATLLKSVYGDKGDDCGCITLTSSCAPGCECKLIGYTSRQMDINEVQTLTVADPDPDCEYNWFITSGGGSLSSMTGTSVTYTAPDSNDGCGENPTITLTVNQILCDTLKLAINAFDGVDTSMTVWTNKRGCEEWPWRAYITGNKYKCNGELLTPSGWPCTARSTAASQEVCFDQPCTILCGESAGWSVNQFEEASPIDKRTEEMIAAGCCLEEFL